MHLWKRTALTTLLLATAACGGMHRRDPGPLTGDPTRDYLVAYYPLHGDGQDKSGHGFHAAMPGGDLNPKVTEGPFGNAGGALQFDGLPNSAAGDFLEVSDRGALQALKPREAVTVAFWAFAPDWKAVTSAGNGKTQDRSLVSTTEVGGWSIYAKTNGKLVFSSYVDGAYRESGVYLGALAPGWHHLAGTYDAATGDSRFYLDGAPAALAQGSSAPIDYDAYPNASLIIGADAEEGGGPESRQDGNTHFLGKLAEVRIYDTPLTPAGIAAVFALK